MTKKELHRGWLDYCEFVIDPDNDETHWGEFLLMTGDYFKDLGMSEKEARGWLLEKLKEERSKRSGENN